MKKISFFVRSIQRGSTKDVLKKPVLTLRKKPVIYDQKKKEKKKSENMPVIYDRSYMTGVGWVGRVG